MFQGFRSFKCISRSIISLYSYPPVPCRGQDSLPSVSSPPESVGSTLPPRGSSIAKTFGDGRRKRPQLDFPSSLAPSWVLTFKGGKRRNPDKGISF